MSDARLYEIEEECGFLADDRGLWARSLMLSLGRIIHKYLAGECDLFDELQRLADRVDEDFAESDEIERLEALWNDLPTFSDEKEGSDDDDD